MRRLFALISLVLATSAMAEWRPEYATQPQWVQDWYATRELNPETRERLGPVICVTAHNILFCIPA